MAYDVTTEWFDLQVKYKNYLPQEKQITNDELDNFVKEVADKYDPLDHKTKDELDELEDIEDERILNMYKERRIKELQEYAKGARYGSLKEIRRHEFIQEVTEGSKECFVVVFLHQEHVELSRVLNNILVRKDSNKYKNVKRNIARLMFSMILIKLKLITL